MDEKIKCPECGSEQITATQKGYGLLTGFIGSGKVMITCLKCGHRFKPGEDKDSVEARPKESKQMERLVIITIILCTIIFLTMCLP